MVPGARLYYEVQGSGPVLLMIPGGPTDAGIFAGLAGFLADRYTVVPYDPRGNSRSVLDGPPEDQRMDLHGDDAAQLPTSLSGEPAHALGSSGGAQIGLNLAALPDGRGSATFCRVTEPRPSGSGLSEQYCLKPILSEGESAMTKIAIEQHGGQSPRKRPAVNYVLWTVQGLLALLFLFAGGMKLALPIEVLTKQMPLPGLFLRSIGMAEVLGRDRPDPPWAPAHSAGSDTAGRRRAGDRHDRCDGAHFGDRRRQRREKTSFVASIWRIFVRLNSRGSLISTRIGGTHA